MKQSRRVEKSTVALLAWIALKLLRIAGRSCRLGVLYAILYFPQYWPAVLWRTAVLGAALSCFYEFVLRVPDFPFSSAMQIPIGCVALLALDRLLAIAVKRASR